MSRAKVFLPILVSAVCTASYAAPAIGVAVTNGEMTVDHASVRSTATLFDGNRIESGANSARIRLTNGASVRLGADTAGLIYHDHLLLEKGATEFRAKDGFAIDTNSYQVKAGVHASARVETLGQGNLRVGALSGDIRVLKTDGTLLAVVAQGEALDFTAQMAPPMRAPESGAEAPPAGGSAAPNSDSSGAGSGGTAAAAAGAGGVAGVSAIALVAGVSVAAAGTAVGVAISQSTGNSTAVTLSPSAQ